MLDWHWGLSSLYDRTLLTQAALARSMGISHARLSRLKGDADTTVGRLIEIYRAITSQLIVPAQGEVAAHPITFHDLLCIEGVPPIVNLPTWGPPKDAAAAIGVDNTWWNTPWLRREIAHATGETMTQEQMADQAGIARSTLSRLENSANEGRISTLIALYSLGRRSIPTLTLHDVLIVKP